MEDRKRIEDRLRKKEHEVEVLEERLKTARVYVQALQDVLKLLDRDSETSAASVLKAGSAVAQARDIILGKGEPVHITAILEAMGKDASRETRASLTSSLAAYVRRHEIFTRPAPNTFGLEELGHVTEDEQDEPPAGFGQMSAVEQPRPMATHRPNAAPSAAPSPKVVPAPAQPKSDIDDDIPF
jgi:hypothetical protein